MRGNWIAMSATQAAANTNPTALAAVANLPTWSDVFGATGSRMVEYEMDDGLGRYECGYGNVNLATGALSRDYPVATFDPSATPKYNSGSPSRLTTFGAAVVVRCAPLASSAAAGETFHLGSQGIGNGYHLGQTEVTYSTGIQGWRNYMPFLWTGSRPIVSASINVKSPATTGRLRLGLMEITAPGVFKLIKEFTEVSTFDLTLSGWQTISDFSKVFVPPGPYVLQFVQVSVSGSISLMAAPGNAIERAAIMGRTSDGRAWNASLSDVGATTLATNVNGSFNGGQVMYNNPPVFLFGM